MNRGIAVLALSVATLLMLGGCDKPAATAPAETKSAAPAVANNPARPPANPERNAYFGDVHIHTSYSFDAFTNGSRTTPEDAYAWAQGKPIKGNPASPPMQLQTPLDFYMVSDHAEYLGVFKEMANPNSPLSKHPMASRVMSPDPAVAIQAFAEILRNKSRGQADPALEDPGLSKSTWAEIVKVADANYQPGKFTTFAGFEWTSNPDKRNLHRVVVFRDTQHLPTNVLSSNDGEDPETLWNWLEAQRGKGSTVLAIPHNANASDGRMFELTKFNGTPIDAAYNATRSKNEPLYEISQIKGTSETNSVLSPTDEFANFELWNYTLSADAERPTHNKGSFARQALLDGMSQEAKGNGNPFKFGFIGDSDTHNAAASFEEFNYTGKFAVEINPAFRLNGAHGMPPGQIQQIREFSSGGLAGVWAEENTREAIFDAMMRKETFGTSGPMIRVRFFGGWDFTADDVKAADAIKRGYARGVPMGSDLHPAPSGKKPSFLVTATKDPKSGNLDRIQIVKGWLDAKNVQHEKIYDVVWSGDRKPNANGKVPAVGNTVDVAKATYTNTIGDAALAAVWTDPDFKAGDRAFYYARVLEIPTPRWSTYDAAHLNVPIPKGLPASIQERAWSSPIWYEPQK